MTGIIKNFLPQKQFGFILGDDGKDYFFHQSSLVSSDQVSQIAEGALVEFDPNVTPKGYKANKVTINSKVDVSKFVVPDSVMLSKTDTIPGWEVLAECGWLITTSDDGNPDDVKESLKNLARRIGANGVAYMNYHKTTGSSGNYHFTVHNFTGRPILVGRRSLSGTNSIDDFADINATAEEYKKKCNDAYANAKSKYTTRLWIGLAVSVGAVVITKGVGLPIAVVAMLVLGLRNRPVLEGEWLRKG